MSLLSQKQPGELAQDIRQKALDIKAREGDFAAIRFLTLEHKVALFEAKQFVEGQDAFGRKGSYRNKSTGIIGKAFLGVAFILLSIAFSIYYLQEDFIKNSVSMDAIVVDMISNGGSYAPVIGYEVSGKTYHTRLNIWTNPPAYLINEKLHVWVSNKDPEHILVDSITGRFLAIIILSGLGFIFGILGILFKLFLSGPA